MQALLWRDFLCPWCYLGRDRTGAMAAMGVEVVPMAYELHPEIPVGGRPIRPGGRYDRLLDRIALECREAGLQLRKPTRTPNTRRALEAAELLRRHFPSSFSFFDDACYRAHWADGEALDDADTLRRLADRAGADVARLDGMLESGAGSEALSASMAAAHDVGVTATPAWWVDDRLLIPGVQPRETVQRWVARLLERSPN